MGDWSRNPHAFARPTINFASNSSSSASFTNLNTAYVHGTSGSAVALRFLAPVAQPIDAVYIEVSSFGGTAANVTMEAKIYNFTNYLRAGTTLRATSTATAMGTLGTRSWIKFTFGSPYTPAKGELVWIVMYNTSASPTVDYPIILTSTNCYTVLFPAASIGAAFLIPSVTTNGYSANGSLVSKAPHLITMNGVHYGNPFGQAVTHFANNALTRGIVFTTPNRIKIGAVCTGTITGAIASVQLFDATTGPGGTALFTHTTGADDEAVGSFIFSSPFELAPGTYKCVLTFGSSSNNPTAQQIDDYSSYSSVFDAWWDNWTRCYSCVDDGAGGWTINKSVSPDIGLYIDEFVESSGGGRVQSLTRGLVG